MAGFMGLVAAISGMIKGTEKNAPPEFIDAKHVTMSSEDEKALIEALKKWKAGELKMPEVFEELSKVRTSVSRILPAVHRRSYTCIPNFRGTAIMRQVGTTILYILRAGTG